MFMVKLGKRYTAFVMVLAMLFSLFTPIGVVAEGAGTQPNDEAAYVTIAVEKFVLGQGYIIEPIRVPIQKGDNLAKLTAAVLGNDRMKSNGAIEVGFHLDAIKDAGAGAVQIPDFILKHVDKDLTDRADADWLGFGDYTSQSGWMFQVNSVFPNVGVADIFLEDGDVVRWQFTLTFGEELMGSIIPIANKDALTRKVAEVNSSPDKLTWLDDAAIRSAYDAANAVLINLESSQTAVDEALVTLKDALGPNAFDLQAAIQRADVAKSSFKVSNDGMDIGKTEFWVRQAEYDRLAAILVEAQQLLVDEDATQAQIDAKVVALNQAVDEFNEAKLPGLLEATTLTLAPNEISLELYNDKNELIDIGQGVVGTYNVYQAFLPSGIYSYKGIDGSGNSIGGGELTVTENAGQRFDFRQLNLKADNADLQVDVDYSVSIEQSGSNKPLVLGTKTASGHYPVLVLTDNTYSYQYEPSESRKRENYLSYKSSVTVTLDSSIQSITGMLPLEIEIKFTVPKDAELLLKKKLRDSALFQEIIPVGSMKDDKTVYSFKLVEDTTYHYRVSQKGKLTNVGTSVANATNTNMEITKDQLEIVTPDAILNRDTYLEGNIYFNLNEQNHLKLVAPGDEFKLLTLRSWQALIDEKSNYSFEPDFQFDIITGHEVIAIEPGEPGGYSLIRAKENGTAIVKVTYDALKVHGSSYIKEAGDAFSAIWPENVGLFVVTVGQGETGISTGMESNKERNQRANAGKTGNDMMNLQNGAFDADIDSIYYVSGQEGAIHTFTPTAGSKVTVLRPEIDHEKGAASYGEGIFSAEGVTTHSDGSFSVLLTEGRNIVKVEKDGLAEYQVMTARVLDVVVDNLTNPNEKVAPGDRVKVTFNGLSFPANKLSDIYTFSAQLHFAGGKNKTVLTADKEQYNITTQGKSLEFQLPSDLDSSYVLNDGYIKVTGYGSPIGAHRAIDPLVGANPNVAALLREGNYSSFPKIVIYELLDKAELKATVDTATAHLASAVISKTGDDVFEDQYWVTASAYNEYAAIIEAAGALLAEEDVNRETIEAKLLVLEQSYAAYTKAKQYGLKRNPLDVTQQLNQHLAYLMSTYQEPVFSSEGWEWSVLALARANYNVPDSYYAKYYDNVTNEVARLMQQGELDAISSIEHARLILALTAIGKDIQEILGYDLREALADFGHVTKQGIKGPILALTALDSYAYSIPASTGVSDVTTREKLIAYILNEERTGGGWSLSGAADPDMTGIAIQALAPYYNEVSEVREAIDRAVAWLSLNQNSNGGYAGLGSENAQSVAQVIVALTSMGIDPHTDARFNKNGHSAVENLLSYAAPDGGFKHDNAVDGKVIDQATYALIAYDRFFNGKKALYDMTDVTITKAEPRLIVELPDKGTLYVANNTRAYTVKVNQTDAAKQLIIQLPAQALAKTYMDLPAAVALPGLTITRGGISAELPQGLEMQGDSRRLLELLSPLNKDDGELVAKLNNHLLRRYLQVDSMNEVVVIGDNDKISFDKGFVTLTFKGMKDKDAAFIQNGDLTLISKYKSEREGQASGRNEYTYASGNDLIVRTNHFTTFVVYTAKDRQRPVAPVNPQATIQMSIDKATIVKGDVLSQTTVAFTSGESVWDVLKRELESRNIAFRYSFSSKHNSVYIESIAGDGELDHGSGSRWMYNVNGVYPNDSASRYILKPGDKVQWRYTTNLGVDLGNPVNGNNEALEESGTGTEGGQNGGASGKKLSDFYTDSVKVSQWATAYVLKATEKSFVEGFKGKFNPDKGVTRAEFVKLLVSVFNVTSDPPSKSSFRDVLDTDWFAAYVTTAHAAGLVEGYGNEFRPHETITREEMAVMMARALKLKATATAATTVFADQAQIADWAQDAVVSLVAQKIMLGEGNRFNPKGTASREMAVVVIMRAFQEQDVLKSE